MAFFRLQGKGGCVGNCLGPLLSWAGFFEPNVWILHPSQGVAKMNLFLGAGFNTRFGFDRLVELGHEALRIDSLVPVVTINLEGGERQINTVFSSIPYRQLSLLLECNNPRLYHGISSNMCPGMLWRMMHRTKLSEVELGLSIRELSIEHRHEVLQSHTELGLRLTYQVQALSIKDLENFLRHSLMS